MVVVVLVVVVVVVVVVVMCSDKYKSEIEIDNYVYMCVVYYQAMLFSERERDEW